MVSQLFAPSSVKLKRIQFGFLVFLPGKYSRSGVLKLAESQTLWCPTAKVKTLIPKAKKKVLFLEIFLEQRPDCVRRYVNKFTLSEAFRDPSGLSCLIFGLVGKNCTELVVLCTMLSSE